MANGIQEPHGSANDQDAVVDLHVGIWPALPDIRHDLRTDVVQQDVTRAGVDVLDVELADEQPVSVRPFRLRIAALLGGSWGISRQGPAGRFPYPTNHASLSGAGARTACGTTPASEDAPTDE